MTRKKEGAAALPAVAPGNGADQAAAFAGCAVASGSTNSQPRMVTRAEKNRENTMTQDLAVKSQINTDVNIKPQQDLGDETCPPLLTATMGAATNSTDSDPVMEPQRLIGGGLEQQPVDPTLRDVYALIQQCSISLSLLTGQVQAVREDVAVIHSDLIKVQNRTTALENRVSGVEDTLPPLVTEVKSITRKVNVAISKADDLENRIRRNNVRVVGIPEKAEGLDPIIFAERWLMDVFGKDNFSPFFSVERAHRVSSKYYKPGSASRPFLIRLLNYRDKENILQRARVLKDIRFNGSKVMFFSDFSSEVQKRRANFKDVKKRLLLLGINYSMLYPARLRLVHNGQVIFFQTPQEANDWLDVQISK